MFLVMFRIYKIFKVVHNSYKMFYELYKKRENERNLAKLGIFLKKICSHDDHLFNKCNFRLYTTNYIN